MASALRHGLRPVTASTSLARCTTTTTTTTPTSSTGLHQILPSLHRASIPPPARPFSTTHPAQKRRTGLPRQGTPHDVLGAAVPIPKPHAADTHIPPYPYGPRRTYKQSNSGLYGSARILFGHNVSEKHNVKTHRVWRPNVQRRRLWSDALRCFVQTRVTTRVLRTIDKCGGLDEYLLGDKAQRIKDLGPWGWKLRWRVMQSEVVQARFRQQRVRLGLDRSSAAKTIDQVMAEAEVEAARLEAMEEIDHLIRTEEDFVFGDEEEMVDEQAAEDETAAPEEAEKDGFMEEKKPA